MGVISLEGMEFYARHGYYEEERKIGNKYSVDVHLYTDFDKAVEDDQLDGTVNYEKVYEIVAQAMSVEAKLLEYLGGKIIKSLKEAFPYLEKVKVKISKHNPPIKGLCRKASVTLER